MPYTVNVDTGELEYNESVAALGGITDITCDVGSVAPVAGVVVLAGGPGINTTGAGNTATVSLDGMVATSFQTDAGTATPVLGVTKITGGTSIATSAVGNEITVDLEPSTIDINNLTGYPLTVPHGGTGTTLVQPNGVVTTGTTGTSPFQSVQLDDGEIIIGVTGGPSVGSTLTAGAGIAITNGAGSITITSTTGGFAWVRVAGVAQNIAVQTGYIPTNAAMTTFTLPATAAIGDGFQIAGEGTGLWRIATQAGQTIYCGVVTTTTGVGGYLTATHRRDCVEVVCTNTDTEWTVVDFLGNLGAT